MAKHSPLQIRPDVAETWPKLDSRSTLSASFRHLFGQLRSSPEPPGLSFLDAWRANVRQISGKSSCHRSACHGKANQYSPEPQPWQGQSEPAKPTSEGARPADFRRGRSRRVPRSCHSARGGGGAAGKHHTKTQGADTILDFPDPKLSSGNCTLTDSHWPSVAWLCQTSKARTCFCLSQSPHSSDIFGPQV